MLFEQLEVQSSTHSIPLRRLAKNVDFKVVVPTKHLECQLICRRLIIEEELYLKCQKCALEVSLKLTRSRNKACSPASKHKPGRSGLLGVSGVIRGHQSGIQCP